MVKYLVVFGTRSEAMKMCPLVQEFRALEGREISVCVTGQHRETLDQILDQFDVSPDFDLQIMQREPTLHDITPAVLDGMKKVLEEYAPNLVFVHGDTPTAFATAQACYHQQIPVVCVEFE